MNISNFFIKRPIFAAVISIVIFVIGTLAYFRLPLSEYPEVVPPTVVVRTSYPGANPTVIADTVASPLEQQINGVEGMLYMFSQATADGVMTLTITFGLGTDLDKAQVQVQNRVSQALPRLPQEVQRLGVTTEKTSPDLLMVVHLESPDNRYDMLYLANLAILQVKDELGRLPGVGNVQVFGAGDFSMRVWLNPNKLASHNLTATDVVQAIREQNVQVGAGRAWCPTDKYRKHSVSIACKHAGAPHDGRRIRQHHCARRQGWPDYAYPRSGPCRTGVPHIRTPKSIGQQAGGRPSNFAAARFERTPNFATGA